MSYQWFKVPEKPSRAATLATVATVIHYPGQTLTTVAGGKSGLASLAAAVACLPEPVEAELEERKGIAMGSMPERYLDAWVQLLLQRPADVTEPVWRQAIDDARKFLAKWGRLAAELGWLPADLFDVPHGGRNGGLCWTLRSLTVIAFGPDHARLSDGSVCWKLA